VPRECCLRIGCRRRNGCSSGPELSRVVAGGISRVGHSDTIGERLDAFRGPKLGAFIGPHDARCRPKKGILEPTHNILKLNDNPPACFTTEQHLEN
jgi:hypothetical protein